MMTHIRDMHDDSEMGHDNAHPRHYTAGVPCTFDSIVNWLSLYARLSGPALVITVSNTRLDINGNKAIDAQHTRQLLSDSHSGLFLFCSWTSSVFGTQQVNRQ